MTEQSGQQPEQPQQPQPEQPTGQTPPPPYGQAPPLGQVPPPPPAGGYGQPAYGAYPPYAAPQPGAPYGVHPVLGIPYSDKQKLVAGLLQIFLPFGIGRFYTGHTNIAIAQLLVTIFTCGIGSIWSWVDGIVMLVTDSKDANGYVLR